MKPLSPTPWRSAEQASEVLFTHTIVDHEGERIARVCSLSRSFGRQRDEGANAAIMAAAPELYECLKSCVATLIAQDVTGPKVTEARRLLQRLQTELEERKE